LSGQSLLVTGADGRLGRLLRLIWGDGAGVIWTARRASPGVVGWCIGQDTPPALPPGVVVLHLAATLRGDADALARNASDTAALCQAAGAAGVAHVFLASTAAVYRPGPLDIPETAPPDPANPYGAAKHAAEQAARATLRGPGLTVLRIGNVAGADALLGAGGPAVLDPVAGQPAGPLRSYIGPMVLAGVLAALVRQVQLGLVLPQVLNVAQPGVVAMGDLLTAAGRDWRFGPPREATVARVGLATDRLSALLPLPPATPAGITADLASLRGRWP